MSNISQVILARNSNGLWRGAVINVDGRKSQFTENQPSLQAALRWSAGHGAAAFARGNINAPPGQVTGPRPPTVPAIPRSPTVYRPLRSRVWTKVPTLQSEERPPYIPAAPVPTGGWPSTAQPSEDSDPGFYMAELREFLSDYNAGGSRRAALGTRELARIISYLDGLIAAREDNGESQSNAEDAAREAAQQ